MKCPSCRIHELVVITLQLSGEPVTLRTCSPCGRRDWEGLDGTLPLETLLALAAPS